MVEFERGQSSCRDTAEAMTVTEARRWTLLPLV